MILPIYKPNHEYLGEDDPNWWVLSRESICFKRDWNGQLNPHLSMIRWKHYNRKEE